MKYKISKELFEQVTGYEGTIHEYNRECIINGDIEEHISINDFFFMCKEWAYKNDYILISHKLANFYRCDIAKRDEYPMQEYSISSSSEQQAVFDACMYILDIKKEG